MAASRVVTGQFGNGQSAQSTTWTLSFSTTGLQAGDILALDVVHHITGSGDPTGITFSDSGWTYVDDLSIQTSSSTPEQRQWHYYKVLAAGDLTGTYSTTVSTGVSRRTVGSYAVYRDVLAPTLHALNPASGISAQTTSWTVPTISGIPGRGIFRVASGARGGTAPNPATPSGYTAGTWSGTTYGAAPQVSIEEFYKLITVAGTYGGEAGTTSVSSFESTIAVFYPEKPANQDATITGSAAWLPMYGAPGQADAPVSIVGGPTWLELDTPSGSVQTDASITGLAAWLPMYGAPGDGLVVQPIYGDATWLPLIAPAGDRRADATRQADAAAWLPLWTPGGDRRGDATRQADAAAWLPLRTPEGRRLSFYKLGVWDGSQWKPATVKVWSGSTWITPVGGVQVEPYKSD